MRILVTGGAGFIGSHTAHQLVARGDDVVILDNLSTGQTWAVPERATLVRGDVGDRDLILRLLREHGIEAVVHFAASIRVDESVSDPLKYYWNNTVNSQILIGACLTAKVDKLVFSSSAAVYGNPPEAMVDERSPTNPVSPYGTSKLMTEWLLRDVAVAHRFRYVALRYFNVAGASSDGRLGQTGAASHLIKVACEAAAGVRSGMAVFGTDYPTKDGTGLRDYIHVEDLARAHLDALAYLARGGGPEVLNCGYGRGYTVQEVIRAMKQVSGVDFPVRLEGRRPGDIGALIANPTRIGQVLGWKPRFDDLAGICRASFEWEKQMLQRKNKQAA